MQDYYGGIYSSCIGDIGIMTHQGMLVYVDIFNNNLNTFNKYDIYRNLCEDSTSKKAANQIMLYLKGINKTLNIKLSPRGSSFQKAVWEILLQIPYGETKSYKDIAIMLGKPNAMRAVGSACAKNPILLFIPCHRIVNNNGKMGGYRAGLGIKERLIMLEKSVMLNNF